MCKFTIYYSVIIKSESIIVYYSKLVKFLNKCAYSLYIFLDESSYKWYNVGNIQRNELRFK